MAMPSTTTSAHQAALRVIPPVDAPAAMSPPWSFEALIAPISPAEFCSICWGRQPLHIQRGLPDFYRDLISLEYVERYLSVEDIFRRPDTIFMRGHDFWSQGEPPANLSEAYARMMRGQPLQLRNLDRVLDPSAPLLSAVRNMELALQHPKESIGGYISRARSAGLGPHHDETEIFTLQIVGRKRWRLFHQVHTDKPGFHDPSALGAPAHEVLLEAGDLLYHPRGWIHDVASEDVPSFSVTIVFQPITWRAVLEGIVERLGALPPFVDQLPAGVLLHDNATELLRQPFDERLAFLRHALSSVSIGDIVDDLVARQVAHVTLPPAQRIDTLFRIDLLALDSRLERQRDVCAAIRVNADGVTLLLPGGYRMSAPADHEAALRWILRVEHPFQARDMEGFLGSDQTLTLVKRLVAAGLLRPA
jgi:ribosomal protein L16 Arg81 hydroxylase